jgi:hypothetical protein
LNADDIKCIEGMGAMVIGLTLYNWQHTAVPRASAFPNLHIFEGNNDISTILASCPARALHWRADTTYPPPAMQKLGPCRNVWSLRLSTSSYQKVLYLTLATNLFPNLRYLCLSQFDNLEVWTSLVLTACIHETDT